MNLNNKSYEEIMAYIQELLESQEPKTGERIIIDRKKLNDVINRCMNDATVVFQKVEDILKDEGVEAFLNLTSLGCFLNHSENCGSDNFTDAAWPLQETFRDIVELLEKTREQYLKTMNEMHSAECRHHQEENK
jgi:hypothetical protein